MARLGNTTTSGQTINASLITGLSEWGELGIGWKWGFICVERRYDRRIYHLRTNNQCGTGNGNGAGWPNWNCGGAGTIVAGIGRAGAGLVMPGPAPFAALQVTAGKISIIREIPGSSVIWRSGFGLRAANEVTRLRLRFLCLFAAKRFRVNPCDSRFHQMAEIVVATGGLFAIFRIPFFETKCRQLINWSARAGAK